MSNRGRAEAASRSVLAFDDVTERGKHHTLDEWLAQPPERRLELIDGAFIEKAAPDALHSMSQGGVIQTLRVPFHRKPGGGGPGGWWILPEVDIQLGANGYRPDVSGWRRERVAAPPEGRPVRLRPDWVCEVLSEGNRTNDTIRKLRRYHEAGVPHYWILSPAEGSLTVFRHHPEGYRTVLMAERHQRVRAEPFDALELHVGQILGDDPE